MTKRYLNKEVEVFFVKPEISSLFGYLLQANGAKIKKIGSANEVSDTGYIITEPNLFSLLSKKQQQRSLVVANYKDSNFKCVLEMPLSEEKIMGAIDKWLE